MSAFLRIQALSETISMARRRKGRPVSGVLLLDKPKGPSSNQALQTAKRLFGAAKAGHTGNLDPMASGVLPICFGEATKLSQYLLDADKQYVTELVLGQSTDTGDAEGSVIREADASRLSRDRLEAILPQFIGPQEQVPPMYSAIKVDGQPLYKRARKGEVVERKSRAISIHSIRCLSFQPGLLPVAELEISCSKGTYIRTLAEDIAASLGCPGHIQALSRTQSGPFDLTACVTIESLNDRCASHGQESLDDYLLEPESCVQHLPRVELSSSAAFYLRQGQPVLVPNAPLSGMVRIAEGGGPMLGLGKVLDDGRIAPKRLFVDSH